MNRRTFLKNNSLLVAGVSLTPLSVWQKPLFHTDFVSKRPPVEKRTFVSEAVENTIMEVKSLIADTELAWMFENCFPNTLDTTVDFEMIDGKPDTFIITGDIDAMWLRDSTAQVWPYLPLVNKDEKLKTLIAGLVNRQVKCVLTDPYANAFYKDLTKKSEWNEDIPRPIAGVHERKWEIDSLCYVIRLSHGYYEKTGDTSVFDPDWTQAMKSIVKTFKTEQRKDGTSPYKFIRSTSNMIDSVPFQGSGNPAKPTGMIHSMFRPSDDATWYPYLIPSNLFAVQSLRQLAHLFEAALQQQDFAQQCRALADEVEHALKQYAIAEHLHFGKILAYEADGYGNVLYMDDANVPSLMSLAYLGIYDAKDKLYQHTRAFILSDNNPYYLKGIWGEGQGSPHTGKEKIWPMGIILRAMTSSKTEEIKHCITMLKHTHADTGFMHEAFHKDHPKDFNRAWFAWANTLFGELILKIHREFPEILSLTY